MLPKLVIFDLDGTLVNTIEDVADSFNEALSENGFPTSTLDEVASLVGGDLETIVGRMLPEGARTRANIDRVKADYRRIYAASPKPKTAPYEGIPQLLDELFASGIGVAVNTNKGQDLAESCIAKLFPGTGIPVVGYVEGTPSKPDPSGAQRLLKEFDCSAPDTPYVGDGMSDAKTANNVGTPFVFCAWGQGDQAAVSQESPDMLVVDNVKELREVLLGGFHHE